MTLWKHISGLEMSRNKRIRRSCGLSPSSLKTLIKHRGYKVRRDFFKAECNAIYEGRVYRFRWWANGEFLVDISCPVEDFDRWANSVERTITFAEWKNVKVYISELNDARSN